MLIGVVLLISWYLVHAVAVAGMSDLAASCRSSPSCRCWARRFILLRARRRRDGRAQRARRALWTSLLTFALSLLLWFDFDRKQRRLPVRRDEPSGCPAFDISYHMGVDGISVLFVLLSTFLTPLCILASWEAIQRAGARNT